MPPGRQSERQTLPQRLDAVAVGQRHFQPFADHKGLWEDLLRQELVLVQMLIGRRRVMVEQKELVDLGLLG